MILIHTALLCEAQSFIEQFKLKKTNSTPKIYQNEKIIVCISGVGAQNTHFALEYIYQNYSIQKAFNIGIAGCNDCSICIGSLYCTNHILPQIDSLKLITSDTIVTNSDQNEPTLYDMEAKYFLEISEKYLKSNKIFIFKIVSDYLEKTPLPKDFVKRLITKQNNLHKFLNLN